MSHSHYANFVNGMILDEECPRCHAQQLVVVHYGGLLFGLACPTCRSGDTREPEAHECSLLICGVCERHFDTQLEMDEYCVRCDYFMCEKCADEGGCTADMEAICTNCVEDDEEDEDASKSESASEAGSESGTASNSDDLSPYIDEEDDSEKDAARHERDGRVWLPVYRDGLPFHLWAAKVLHDYQRSIDREKSRELALTSAPVKDIPDNSDSKETVNKHVHPDYQSEEDLECDIAHRHRKKQCLDTND
jgi:hypothetical protein